MQPTRTTPTPTLPPPHLIIFPPMPAPSRSRRLTALLLGLLFSMVVAEPLRAHDCAMHMGTVRSTATPVEHTEPGSHGEQQHGENGHGHQHHAASATTANSHTAAGHSSGNHSESQDSHACDCVGTCSTVAAVRLAVLPTVPTAVVDQAEPELPAILSVTPAPRTARLLPFPNGPPLPAL